MRFATAFVAALAFVLLAEMHSASAQRVIVYPWCLDHGSGEGYFTTCAFSTLGQCRQSGSGDGGFCYPNPAYRPIVERPRREPRRQQD